MTGRELLADLTLAAGNALSGRRMNAGAREQLRRAYEAARLFLVEARPARAEPAVAADTATPTRQVRLPYKDD